MIIFHTAKFSQPYNYFSIHFFGRDPPKKVGSGYAFPLFFLNCLGFKPEAIQEKGAPLLSLTQFCAFYIITIPFCHCEERSNLIQLIPQHYLVFLIPIKENHISYSCYVIPSFFGMTKLKSILLFSLRAWARHLR
jgi:hypothetical protein